jgi:ketosteroid isomerase-like protein
MTIPLLTIDGLEQMPSPDNRAIAETVGHLFSGFIRRDADALLHINADDADWVNAFGSVKRGAAEIVSYLRRLTSDVVTVSTHLRIAGQGLVGGGAILVRDNHSLRMLQRQADCRWLIVSEIYMDANTEQSYAGHS